MSKTIRITGVGEVKVKPDMQRITFSCDEISKTYEDSLILFEKKNKQAKEAINNIGFDASKLLLSKFDISQEYEYFDERVGNKKYSKKEIVGYKLSMGYTYEMEVDTQKLGKLLYCIKGYLDLNNNIDTDVRIGYFVKDEKKCKNEAIKKAIADCKEKGALLAEAAGIKLGEISDISYSWNRLEIEDNTSYFMRDMCCEDRLYGGGRDSFDEDTEITTSDIGFQVEADMVFEIK